MNLTLTLVDRSCMHQVTLFYCVRAEREPFLFNLMQLRSFFHYCFLSVLFTEGMCLCFLNSNLAEKFIIIIKL